MIGTNLVFRGRLARIKGTEPDRILLEYASDESEQWYPRSEVEAAAQPLRRIEHTTDSGWCPSCTCGWHKPIDAFDVTPPETECRNTVCQCHQGFWDTDPVLVVESFDELDDRSFDELEDELTKRRLWGDR